LNNFFHKYRKFHAHNRYSYPTLFMAIGCGKALLQIGVVFAVVWYAVSVMSNRLHGSDNALVKKISGVVGSSRFIGLVDSKQQSEIPATAASQATSLTLKSRMTSHPAKAGVYNADWLLKQDVGAYVVQLASSTVKPDLYQKAFELSKTHPAVVYPFKKTRSNRLMYGYAIGIYDSVGEAKADVNQLSRSAVAQGVWIRPVSEIQKEIISTRG